MDRAGFSLQQGKMRLSRYDLCCYRYEKSKDPMLHYQRISTSLHGTAACIPTQKEWTEDGNERAKLGCTPARDALCSVYSKAKLPYSINWGAGPRRAA